MSSFLIKFGKSTSKNYEYAVELASRFDTYEKEGNDKTILHSVLFSDKQLDDFFQLYDLVGKWKSTKIYIDGELLLNHNFLWCFKERSYAYSPVDYCFNKEDGNSYNDNYFGCKYIEVNPLSYQGLSGFGTMKEDGTFIVDKNKIHHYLMNCARRFGPCPAFDLNNMIGLLNELPDEINPRRQKDWEYVFEYSDGREHAVAVKKSNHNFSFYKMEDEQQSYEHEYKPVSKKETAAAKSSATGCSVFLLTLIISVSIPIIIFLGGI